MAKSLRQFPLFKQKLSNMISSTVTIILMRFSFSSFVPIVVSLTSRVNISQIIWRNRGSFPQTHLSIPENLPLRSSRMFVHLNINANLPMRMNSALKNFWRELRNSRSWTCNTELTCRLVNELKRRCIAFGGKIGKSYRQTIDLTMDGDWPSLKLRPRKRCDV